MVFLKYEKLVLRCHFKFCPSLRYEFDFIAILYLKRGSFDKIFKLISKITSAKVAKADKIIKSCLSLENIKSFHIKIKFYLSKNFNQFNANLIHNYTTKPLLRYKNFSKLIFTNEFKKFNEIIISNLLHNNIKWKNLEISFLSSWVVSSIKSYTTFNGFQTRLFPFVISSDSNLLIGSPTGSGKSLLIIFSILRVVINSIKLKFFHGKIDTDFVKILCIAPMKALVKEIIKNIENSFIQFGLIVSEITGDSSISLHELSSSNIIIGTPEKIKMFLQSRTEKKIFQSIKLVVLDEIHFIREERGAILESLLVYFTKNFANSQKNIRVLALSATIPNFFDIAKFLNINISNGLFYFGSFIKENDLNQIIIGIKSKKSNLYDKKMLNSILLEKVVKLLDSFDNPKIIIFVQSRKDTYKTGFFLKEEIKQKKNTVSTRKDKFLKNAKFSLIKLLKVGIGIHHSGLSKNEKDFMEKSFKSENLDILISTSTLAWGVNLKATHVIIKGTKIYSAKKASWVEIASSNIVQMLGRAGRFYSGKNDTSFIITLSKNIKRYLKLIRNQSPIESTLLIGLPDFLNAEITFQRIIDFSSAKNWFTETFLWIRIQRLLFKKRENNIESLPREFGTTLRSFFISQALNELSSSGLIKIGMKNHSISSTVYGNISAFYLITYQTFLEMISKLTSNKTLCELLNLISCLSEFLSYYPRKNEYYELFRLSLLVSIPIKQSWKTAEFKVNILIQSYIDNVRLRNNSLLIDCVYICKIALKISRILFEICLIKKWSNMTQICFDLYSAIKNRGWFYQNNFWTAFKGTISKKYSDQMKKRDFSLPTIQSLKNSEMVQIIKSKIGVINILRPFSLLPFFEMEFSIQPITRFTIKIFLNIIFFIPDFNYLELKYIGIWIFIDDHICDTILYAKYFGLKDLVKKKEYNFSILIPIFENPASPYYILKIKFDTIPILNTEYIINLSDISYPLNCPIECLVSKLTLTPIARLLIGFQGANSIKEYSFSHMKTLNIFFSENMHINLKGGQHKVIGLFKEKEKSFFHEFSILCNFMMKRNFQILFSNTGTESLFLKVLEFKRSLNGILGVPVEIFCQNFLKFNYFFKPNQRIYLLKNLEISSFLKKTYLVKNKKIIIIIDFKSTSSTLEMESSFEILLESLVLKNQLNSSFLIILTLSKLLNVKDIIDLIKLKNLFQGFPSRTLNQLKSKNTVFSKKFLQDTDRLDLRYFGVHKTNKSCATINFFIKKTIFFGLNFQNLLNNLRRFILSSGFFLCFEYFEISSEKFLNYYITNNTFSSKSQKFLLSIGLGFCDNNFKIEKRKLIEELNLSGFYNKFWIPLSSITKLSNEKLYCLVGILDKVFFIENRLKSSLYIHYILFDHCKKILDVYNQYLSKNFFKDSFSFPVESSWKTFFLEKGNISFVTKKKAFLKKNLYKKLKFFTLRLNSNPRFYLSFIKVFKQIKLKNLALKLILKLKKKKIIYMGFKNIFLRTLKGIIMNKHFHKEMVSRFLIIKFNQKKRYYLFDKIPDKIETFLTLKKKLFFWSSPLTLKPTNLTKIIFNPKKELIYFTITHADLFDFYGYFSNVLFYIEKIRIRIFEKYLSNLNATNLMNKINFTVFLFIKIHDTKNFICLYDRIFFLLEKKFLKLKYLALTKNTIILKSNMNWIIKMSIKEKNILNLELKHEFFKDSVNKTNKIINIPTKNDNNIWWILIGDKNTDKILGRFQINDNKSVQIYLSFDLPIAINELKVFIINERVKSWDTESNFDFCNLE